MLPVGQRNREGHCPVGHHRGLLKPTLGRVGDDGEQGESAVDVAAVEAGVAVHGLLQEEVHVAHTRERVVPVEALEVRRPVGDALGIEAEVVKSRTQAADWIGRRPAACDSEFRFREDVRGTAPLGRRCSMGCRQRPRGR